MLENYYQNSRRYVKSLDPIQLIGLKSSVKEELTIDCEPFRYKENKREKTQYKYEPCGAIANSLFNDTFTIYYVQKIKNESILVNISRKNLAWQSDRKFRFIPPKATQLINPHTTNTIRPPNWAQSNLSVYSSIYDNEDLIVWMRTSAFPTFLKLYGRILIEENSKLADKILESNRTSSRINRIREHLFSKFNDTSIFGIETISKKPETTSRFCLPRGQYYVEIDYRYMVSQFAGRKYFVLTNVSWIGGKCNFLAITYIVVGCLCFVTSFALFFFHVYFGHMDYNSAVLLIDSTTGLVK
jgi:hypothetical protein